MLAKNSRLWTWGAYVLTFVIGAVCIFVAARWVVTRSAAFDSAVREVKTSPKIVDSVGRIHDARLNWFGPASVDETDIDGRKVGAAEFTVDVDGDRGHGEANVHLALKNGQWEVESLTFKKK